MGKTKAKKNGSFHNEPLSALWNENLLTKVLLYVIVDKIDCFLIEQPNVGNAVAKSPCERFHEHILSVID